MYKSIEELIGEDESAFLKVRVNEVGLFVGEIMVGRVRCFIADNGYTIDDVLAALDGQVEAYLFKPQSV